MAYNKEKKVKYVELFDDYKKLCQLNKKRSPNTILFCTDDLPDEWLIDVVEYKTKSGKVTDTYLITQEQFKDHIRWLGKDGFDILTKF